MQLIVRAFPLLPGAEEEVLLMAHEVQTTRAAAAREFYARMGVARESWHLQRTPHGTWIIGVTQIADRPVAEVAEAYASSQEPFDRWFKDRVLALSGIDPDAAPLGPPTECIFDTAAG